MTDGLRTSPEHPSTRLHAHAKLTWSLRVTGVRPDGFHLIDAEMVSLDLHDELVVEPGGHGLDAVGPFAEGVPLDGSNLVARALTEMETAARVTNDKRIPHGGGRFSVSPREHRPPSRRRCG